LICQIKIFKMTFTQKLIKIVKKNNSLLCVGLDSDIENLPEEFKAKKYPQFEFNKFIIDKTYDLVCAYKPNSAFYEAKGAKGIEELKMTVDYIKNKDSDIVIILDAKRADIGSTNKGYAKFTFDYLKADAITLHPYLGKEAIGPFLEKADKGCIIVCRTSNSGAGEFQDLVSSGKKLYQQVALNVVKNWNTNKNCLLVVGATYPKELADVRKLAGDEIWFLVPGIGAQGGDVEKTVRAGQNSKGTGMIINSARGIIFSKNPEQAGKELRDKINKYRISF